MIVGKWIEINAFWLDLGYARTQSQEHLIFIVTLLHHVIVINYVVDFSSNLASAEFVLLFHDNIVK